MKQIIQEVFLAVIFGLGIPALILAVALLASPGRETAAPEPTPTGQMQQTQP